MSKRIIVAAIAAGLAGCASAPTGSEQASADYGYAISQEQAETAAKQFLSTRLKDPMSAQWQCGEATKGYWKDGIMYGGTVHYGYTLQCQINAKNSFGGYNGSKPYAFVIYNGQVVSAYTEEAVRPGSSVTMMEKIF